MIKKKFFCQYFAYFELYMMFKIFHFFCHLSKILVTNFDMEKKEAILSQLEEKGREINENAENMFSFPYEISVSVPDFAELSHIVFDSRENSDLVIGFLSSFPLYILQNIYKYKNESMEINTIIEIFLQFSQVSTEFIPINLLCSALSNIILKTHKVTGNILDFLLSSQNHIIKPFYLSTLSDFLPEGFIFSNRQYFIDTFPQAFSIATLSQRNFILQLINHFDFAPSELLEKEDLWKSIWDHLIDICFSDHFDEELYYMAMKILGRYEEKHHDIIDIENTIIGTKLYLFDGINQNDNEARFNHIKRCILLIPYMNPVMIHYLIKHAIRLATKYINEFSIAPKIEEIQIVSTILQQNIGSPISSAIFEQLRKKARDVNYHEGATYLFALFLPSFEDQTNVVSVDLKHRINEIFTLQTHHYDVIMKCIKYCANESNAFKEMLPKIIPKLFEITKGDETLLVPFFKMLKSLIQNDFAIDSLLTLLFENLNVIPIQYIGQYFKVFNEMIDHASDIQYKTIVSFLTNTIEDENIDLARRGYALLSLDEYSIKDESLLLANYPTFFSVVDQLLKSDLLELSIFTVDYVNDVFLLLEDHSDKLSFHDFALEIFKYLLSIAGDEEKDPKIRINSAKSAAILANNFSNGDKEILQDFAFPNELAEVFISADDISFIICSLFIFTKSYSHFPENCILEAFNIASTRSFHENSSVLVNETLNFASYIVRNIEKIPQSIIDYISSIFIGRFAFLDGIQIFDYTNSNFKLFKVIKSLCERQNYHFIEHLISSFSFIDPINYKKASSAVLTYFQTCDISDEIITEKWNYFNSILENNIFSDSIQYVIHILLVIFEKGYTYLDPSKFVSSLYNLWDEGDDTNQEILIDSIIFVLSHSKDPIENRKDIFSSIFHLLIHQDSDVDYERICINCLSLIEEKAGFYGIEREVLCFIASIITKNENDLMELGEELPVKEMVECLGQISVTKPELAREVLLQFEENTKAEEQLLKLKHLFTSSSTELDT